MREMREEKREIYERGEKERMSQLRELYILDQLRGKI